MSQAGSKPVPAPQTRSGVRDMSPSGFHRRDRLKHPLPSARKGVWGKVCGAVLGVRAPGRQSLKSSMDVFLQQGMCVCMGMRMWPEFFGQGRSRLNLGSSYCLGLVGGVCTGAVVSSMLLASQVDSRVHVWA